MGFGWNNPSGPGLSRKVRRRARTGSVGFLTTGSSTMGPSARMANTDMRRRAAFGEA